jgi:hypothetical protein
MEMHCSVRLRLLLGGSSRATPLPHSHTQTPATHTLSLAPTHPHAACCRLQEVRRNMGYVISHERNRKWDDDDWRRTSGYTYM